MKWPNVVLVATMFLVASGPRPQVTTALAFLLGTLTGIILTIFVVVMSQGSRGK